MIKINSKKKTIEIEVGTKECRCDNCEKLIFNFNNETGIYTTFQNYYWRLRTDFTTSCKCEEIDLCSPYCLKDKINDLCKSNSISLILSSFILAEKRKTKDKIIELENEKDNERKK